MTEVLDVTVQLVDLGDRKVVDIEPPVDEVREQLLRENPFLKEIPDEALVFIPRDPEEGKPFSEIDCAKVRAAIEARRLEFDDLNFAREIGEILMDNDYNVTFRGEVPMSERGYGFVTVTPYSPPVETPAAS